MALVPAFLAPGSQSKRRSIIPPIVSDTVLHRLKITMGERPSHLKSPLSSDDQTELRGHTLSCHWAITACASVSDSSLVLIPCYLRKQVWPVWRKRACVVPGTVLALGSTSSLGTPLLRAFCGSIDFSLQILTPPCFCLRVMLKSRVCLHASCGSLWCMILH